MLTKLQLSSLLVALPLLAESVGANPLPLPLAVLPRGDSPRLAGARPPAPRGAVLPLARSRALSLVARADDGSGAVFTSSTAELVRREQAAVRNKYADAMRYLSGVQLAQADVGIDPAAAVDALGLGDVAPAAQAADALQPAAVTGGLTVGGVGDVATALAGAATSGAASTPSGAGAAPAVPTTLMQMDNLAAAAAPRTATFEDAAVDYSERPSESPAEPSSAGTGTGTGTSPAAPAPAKRDAAKRDAAGAVALTDYISGSMDVLYYGSIEIGTPAQRMTVDFDTGSADLWVPVDCGSCAGNNFDAGASATYASDGTAFEVQYGSGDVSGTLAQDTVSMAGTAVAGQYFGAVGAESDGFAGNPNDGVIGMAFGAISASGKPTYFENLVAAGGAEPYFGVYMTRQQAEGSEICLGCIDDAKYTGELTYVPVVSKTYWSVAMTSLTGDGQRNALSKSIIGAIDTGTTLIYLPDAVASAFYAQIPGSAAAPDLGPGFYTYPCAAAPAVALGFDGHAFAVSLKDFNLGRLGAGSAACVGAVLAVGDGFPDDLAIVGDAFLKSWYSVYDYSDGARVGFAKSINN